MVEVDVENLLIYINLYSRKEMGKRDCVELLLFLQWLVFYKQVSVDLSKISFVILSAIGVEKIACGIFIIVY